MPSGNELRHSGTLEVHRWSDKPEVAEVVRRVFADLFPKGGKSHYVENRKRHLQVIVLNVWHYHLEDPTKYIGVSLNRNKFAAAKRYNKLSIGYRSFADTIHRLRSHGYIEFARGWKDRNTGKGFQTRIRAANKLIRLLEQSPKLSAAAMEVSDNQETLILRNNAKKAIDYTDRGCPGIC